MTIQEDIYLVIIGAAIGFISSIGTTIITELIKKIGKVKIFYKVVFSKVHQAGTWGFRNGSEGMIFEVPLWIEAQNTSNSVRIIRDLNILLFKGGKELTPMIQITNTEDEWYGHDGAYSFVLEPRSIKKYRLHFIKKKNEMGTNWQFDEIKLSYFDENNRKKIFPLIKIDKCWDLGNLKREGIWKLAKSK